VRHKKHNVLYYSTNSRLFRPNPELGAFSLKKITFLAGILSLIQDGIFEIRIKFLIFFIPWMTYLKKKKISPLRRAIFQIFQNKNRKR
jgi:hypothetical protein